MSSFARRSFVAPAVLPSAVLVPSTTLVAVLPSVAAEETADIEAAAGGRRSL
jgi:hypothetical protein